MVMRINGLGQGPLADRRMLGERQKRGGEHGDGSPRHGPDVVHRSAGVSEQLRAEFAAINRAIRETEDALALSARAEQGLEEAGLLLRNLEQVLGEAAKRWAETGAVSDGAADSIGEAVAALERVAETTSFGSRRLLDGSLGCSGVGVGDGLDFVSASQETRSSPPQGYEVLLSMEPVRATVLGEQPLPPQRPVDLVLQEGGRKARVRVPAGQPALEVVKQLTREVQRNGLALGVDATPDGRLLVQHRQFGAAYRFAVASSQPGLLSTPEGGARIVANGCDIAGTINGEAARGEGQTLTGRPGNPTTAGLVVRYTGLPYQDSVRHLPRKPASVLEPRTFAGRVVVAQQALTLRLGSDPGGTVTLQLNSVRPEHLARGIATASGFGSLAEIRASTRLETQDALALVGEALAQVERERYALEGLMRERLSVILARLQVQAQNLAAASPEPLLPGAVLEAVQLLSRRIQLEGRSALHAQTQPPQGALLGLLDDRQKETPPRWN